MSQEQEQQYQQIVGEYIGLMASLENALTILLIEYLNVQDFREEFSKWFIEAPIPFSYKITLLKRMMKDNIILSTNFPNFWKDLHELQEFRNVIAHSFGSFGDVITARDKKIPTQHVTSQAIYGKLTRLKKLEDAVKYMYYCKITGPMPPISADDYADWPI